jgi:3'-phosphoadenosine 5'-phosphosulfate (PAPS) 3'-phosphatase
MNYDYTKEWDVAMAEPHIHEQGGFLCDLNANEFTYNRKDPFNRNGYIASIAFEKAEIMRFISPDLLIRKLG